jgi:phospholipid/cholesterol/gamma-HCH transport system substrate-binding protein
MGKRANPALIGGFVVGAITLTVLMVVLFGSGRFFQPTHTYVLFFEGSVNGLSVGAPVKFLGVSIGSVRQILLQISDLGRPQRRFIDETNRVPVVIDIDENAIEKLGGDVHDLGTRSGLDEMIKQGLRARLQTESIVTGVLFVELEVVPGAPLTLVLPEDSTYLEIPTLPSTLQQVTETIGEIMSKLNGLDFEGLFKSIRGAVDGIEKLVNDPATLAAIRNLSTTLESVRALSDDLRKEVGPLSGSVKQAAGNIRKTLDDLEKTLGSVRVLLDPQAPLAHQLTDTLAQLGVAASAVGRLADELERDPSALVYGKERDK